MFRAPDPVQSLICLPASRSKIKSNVKVFLTIIKSHVYTSLIDDRVWN